MNDYRNRVTLCQRFSCCGWVACLNCCSSLLRRVGGLAGSRGGLFQTEPVGECPSNALGSHLSIEGVNLQGFNRSSGACADALSAPVTNLNTADEMSIGVTVD